MVDATAPLAALVRPGAHPLLFDEEARSLKRLFSTESVGYQAHRITLCRHLSTCTVRQKVISDFGHDTFEERSRQPGERRWRHRLRRARPHAACDRICPSLWYSLAQWDLAAGMDRSTPHTSVFPRFAHCRFWSKTLWLNIWQA